MVWACPFSLAATGGIEFSFFSSGYLDVSVPRVASAYSLYAVCRYYSAGVVPFGDLRVEACLRLSVAFRSLPRPSSAPSAMAFTVCPFLLDLCLLYALKLYEVFMEQSLWWR